MPQRTGIRRPRGGGLGRFESRSLEHRGRQPQPRRRLLAQRLLRRGGSRGRGHVRRRAFGRPRRGGRLGKRGQVGRPAMAGVLLERSRRGDGVFRLLGRSGLERAPLLRGRPVRTRHRAVRELVRPRPFDARTGCRMDDDGGGRQPDGDLLRHVGLGAGRDRRRPAHATSAAARRPRARLRPPSRHRRSRTRQPHGPDRAAPGSFRRPERHDSDRLLP